MNPRRLFITALPAMTALALLAGPAASQQKSMKDQIVGAWEILLDDNVGADGTRTPIFGPNPSGIVLFDSSGRYALQLAKYNNPKLASNNRNTGTADENKAVVQGTLAHFGRYSVDEANKTLIFHIESSTFPNWENTIQKRPLTILSPDDLKWITPEASGGGSAELIWRRIK